ncbi:hypothetical protein JCM9533A_80370 [Catenuloplanes niger JCM 9533]
MRERVGELADQAVEERELAVGAGAQERAVVLLGPGEHLLRHPAALGEPAAAEQHVRVQQDGAPDGVLVAELLGDAAGLDRGAEHRARVAGRAALVGVEDGVERVIRPTRLRPDRHPRPPP